MELTYEKVGRATYANYDRIRAARGVTNQRVAVAAGINPVQISRWKLYGAEPRNVAILKICKTLGCGIQDLYKGIL